MQQAGYKPSTRRVLAASLVGTGIEFYDFYVYATAASLVFGEIFFPSAAPGMQQMASFATLAVAFFARPVGAARFGRSAKSPRGLSPKLFLNGGLPSAPASGRGFLP